MTAALMYEATISPLHELRPDETALFFDFDGVIADIADDPGNVSVEDTVLHDIAELRRMSSGALAIVSGRDIAQIDTFLSPLRLPVAGVHGAERRTLEGDVVGDGYDKRDFSRLRSLVTDFAENNDGLLSEPKQGSVALHYRNRPDLEDTCLAFAEELKAIVDGATIVRGKMVVEAKLADCTKADAVCAFMNEPPFHGRMPVYFGDDITDEDGFRAANALGGLSVKIGNGKTVATERLATTTDFRAWLSETAERWRHILEGTAGRQP